MRVLIACEESGIVRSAFSARGHDAWSCDILPSRVQGNHYQCDVRDVLGVGWDMIISHPPCTYLCNSGVRWLHTRPGRVDAMRDAVELFNLFMTVDVARVAIENPIPHRYAVDLIGRKYDQLIQPWQFGHGEQKATCLWLRGLPPLVPTNIVSGREQRLWRLPPGETRQRERSATYSGIAQAMAEQWG
jgi:hypothetical protein